MISDDFCIGFVVSFLMNMFDVIVIGLYALIMLKKKWYKGNGVQTGKPTVIGITAAAFGYLYAQHAFKNSTVNQSLCILAVVIMIGMFLINIGLIGFIKYYCYVQINSADNRQDV